MVKKQDISFFFLALIILINTGLFQLISFSLDNTRSVISVLICFFFFIYICANRNKYIIKKTDIYVVFFFLVILEGILIGAYNFNYSPYQIWYALRQYLWILLYFPLSRMMINKFQFIKCLKTISNCYLFMLGIRFLTALMYDLFHITLFEKILLEYGSIWTRNGDIVRIDSTSLMFIVLVIIIYFLYETKKIKYLLEILFILLYLIVVNQTRIMIYAALITLGIMIFLSKKRSKIINVSFCLLIIIILFNIIKYLQVFDSKEILQYRFYELNYFSGLLNNANRFTGLGIFSTVNSQVQVLLHGNLYTQMYLDDLGVLEFILQFGFVGFILLYIGLIILIISTLIKVMKDSDRGFTIIVSGFLSYIVVSSISLNLFSLQRIFALPIVLAILSFINRNQKKC